MLIGLGSGISKIFPDIIFYIQQSIGGKKWLHSIVKKYLIYHKIILLWKQKTWKLFKYSLKHLTHHRSYLHYPQKILEFNQKAILPPKLNFPLNLWILNFLKFLPKIIRFLNQYWKYWNDLILRRNYMIKNDQLSSI